MSFISDETSVDSAEPIEVYMFTYNGLSYTYTSSKSTVILTIDGNKVSFSPEYIERSESLTLGSPTDSKEACVISVLRNNDVALLYQGAPPEQDSVNVKVYRIHGDSPDDYVKLVDGIVSQVRFKDSKAELTINIENVLIRNVPRGKLSYYCQNCVYDDKCKVNEDAYTIRVGVDKIDKLMIKSSTIGGYEDGYFTDGYIKMGNAFRQIREHKGDTIYIKYPINAQDREDSFTIRPGCDNLFYTCATKFHNTDNFSGVPYIEPYNAFRNPVGKGAYWIRDDVIVRDTNGRIYD